MANFTDVAERIVENHGGQCATMKLHKLGLMDTIELYKLRGWA